MNPLSLAPGIDNAGPPQISEMTRDFGLALSEDFNEIADANLPAIHQVQKPQPRAIRERREQEGQIVGFWGTIHAPMIYALTNMSSR